MSKCPFGTCRALSAGSEVNHFLPGLSLQYSGSFAWLHLTWAQWDLLTSCGQNTTNSFTSAHLDPEAEERDLPPLKCQRSDICRRTSTLQMPAGTRRPRGADVIRRPQLADTSAALFPSSPAHLSSWKRGNKSDRVQSLSVTSR